MRSNEQERAADVASTIDHPDLDSVTSYDDGDAIVVCDRSNPQAWIRSDTTTSIDN